jgi:hypothetical protein
MDWINLAEDRDQWRALVNTVLYLQASTNVEGKIFEFLRDWRLRKKNSVHGVSKL